MLNGDDKICTCSTLFCAFLAFVLHNSNVKLPCYTLFLLRNCRMCSSKILPMLVLLFAFIFSLPPLLIELFYIGVPVVRTDARRTGGRTVTWLPNSLTKWCSMVLRCARSAMKCIIIKREECIRSSGTLICHILGRQPQNVTSQHLFLFFKKWFELSSWRAATNWEVSPVL